MRRILAALVVIPALVVGCGDPEGPASPDESGAPGGATRATEVECPQGERAVSASIDYFAEPTGEKGDPGDIARRTVSGIESGDKIVSLEGRRADVREIGVVRGGKLIAVLSYVPAQNGGWYLGGYTACESSGIDA